MPSPVRRSSRGVAGRRGPRACLAAAGPRGWPELGDLLDRGDSKSECWELMQRLKEEARASGGGVVCLIGNRIWPELRAAWRILRLVQPVRRHSGRALMGPACGHALAPLLQLRP